MPLTIMVVDDESLTPKVVRSLAVPLGHKVLTPADGQEAYTQAERQHFDVIFMGMPRRDGFEFAHQVRQPKPNSDTVVVMLTDMLEIDTLRKAFAAGFSFVLPKPIVAARVIPMLTAMDSPTWKDSRHSARLPLFTQVNCRCDDQDLPMRAMNISETGMLLQSTHNLDVGQEVSLGFQISEVSASLSVRARIVRKEGSERLGIEFLSLEPEDQNAIQIYVMGHLKRTPSQRQPDFRARRVFNP